MACSRRKNGSATRGRFKPKKMGKGYMMNRKQPIGTRPVLRLTEPDAPATDAASGGKTPKA